MHRFFKTKILFFVTALTIVTVNKTSAQDQQASTYSFTLEQAIDYAVQNQPALLNAAIDQQIAQKRVNELKGVGLPQISGSVDAKKFIRVPTVVIPAIAFGGPEGVISTAQFGLEYEASAGLSASQLVLDGSYIVGLKASKTYVELSRKNYQQSKIETALQVSKAYYNVLVNAERMDLLNANVERIKKLRDDTKAFYDNGFVEKIDFDRIDITYNNIVTEKQKTEKLLELGKLLLKYQMGMDMNANLALTDDLKNIKFDESLPADQQTDYTKRIEYSALQTTQRLQELDLKKNQYQYLPSLVLYGGLSTHAYRFEFDFFDSDKKWYPTAVVGATLSIPIFDGFQKNSRIQQAKLNLKKIENSFKSLEQGIALETSTAKVNLQNSISSLETQRKNRELAEEVTRVSKIKYDQGVGSNLEVTTAETSLKEAETNYYSALFDALVAKIDYHKATGALLKN
jgi:outer membrane protein